MAHQVIPNVFVNQAPAVRFVSVPMAMETLFAAFGHNSDLSQPFPKRVAGIVPALTISIELHIREQR